MLHLSASVHWARVSCASVLPHPLAMWFRAVITWGRAPRLSDIRGPALLALQSFTPLLDGAAAAHCVYLGHVSTYIRLGL